MLVENSPLYQYIYQNNFSVTSRCVSSDTVAEASATARPRKTTNYGKTNRIPVDDTFVDSMMTRKCYKT